MYEKMRIKVESVVERGNINPEYITNEEEQIAFNKWSKGFSRHEHPAVIQVGFIKSIQLMLHFIKLTKFYKDN